MRRRNRTLEIFSLSAIDLFASAMGAFIVFSAILIPYYPNMKDGGQKVERLEAEIQAELKKITESDKSIKQIEAEQERRNRRRQAIEAAKKRAADQAKRVEAERSALMARTIKVDAENKLSAEKLAALRGELDQLKKRNAAHQQATPTRETDFSILGITTKKKSIVIVVDLSGSMKESATIVTNTLKEIIEPFHDKISFAILGYQGAGVTRMFPPAPGRMARADARSKIGARAFINILPTAFAGSTPTKAALLRALAYRPQAIILVSDGEPTDDTMTATLQDVTAANRDKVEIHTVAIGDYLKHTDLIQFLNNLAKRNKGRFVGVIR